MARGDVRGVCAGACWVELDAWRAARAVKNGEEPSVVAVETCDGVCGAAAGRGPARKGAALREVAGDEITRYRS